MRALNAMLLALAGTLALPVGAADDYILVTQKPDKMVLIDAAARAVKATHTIPDAAPGALTVTPSPDGRIGYAVVNRWESVSGIDLDTGEQVFRADFSSGETRAKAMFGMDISPDGKELFVFLSPVQLKKSEYQVGDTHIAVYNTADGVGAKPVRTFPAPRRTAILALSDDGSKLYAIGWDAVVLDPATGEQIGVHPIRNWGRENFTEPDVLDVWPQFEQAGVFSTPYFSVRTDKAGDDPAAYAMGMLTLDLASDEFVMEEYENFEVIIFSTVVNPVRRNEVYGVYTQLSKIDIEADRLVDRIDLPHTYYAVNVSSDGSELYAGGTMNDIGVYDTETLEHLATIELPGGNMALTSVRMIQR